MRKSALISQFADRRQPVREAESPGMRLMTFLTTHQAQIMAREKDNERFVYLYGIGNYWVAFERSAYLLCRLLAPGETSVIRFVTYPFPVVMVTVSDEELRAYSRSHIFKRDESDYKEFIAPQISPRQYHLWHRDEVRKYQ